MTPPRRLEPDGGAASRNADNPENRSHQSFVKKRVVSARLDRRPRRVDAGFFEYLVSSAAKKSELIAGAAAGNEFF